MTTATRRLARSTAVDVSADGVTWLTLPGMTDNAPQITPTKQDSSDYDSNGWAASEITMQAWTLAIKYNKLAESGTPDPVQELIRARQAQFADAARLYVRWYDTDGGAEAWSGRAIVEIQRSKTAVADLAEVTVTLTGDGPLTSISNPFTSTAVAVILSAAQTGTGVGSLVTLTGQHFTGATAVKFGATSATTFVVLSDSTISVLVPASSTGSQVLTVVTPAGTSAGLTKTIA